MAVRFATTNSRELLAKFNIFIKKNKIETWEYIPKNGINYITHTSEDHKKKAFFESLETDNELIFHIRSEGDYIDKFEYSYYHGHLIQTFIHHLSLYFSTATATPFPDLGEL